MPKAKAYINKALSLEPLIAEAYVSLGAIYVTYDWDSEAAGREYARAVALDPAYVTGHWWYGCWLYAVGRHQEGRPEWETALRLDPLSNAILLDVAEIEAALGRVEVALSLCRKAIAIQPSFSVPYRCEANMLDLLGQRPEAKVALEKAVGLSPENPAVLAELAALRMREGRRAEAQDILRRVLSMSQTRYVPAFVIAKMFFILGDERTAVEWLERAREERSPRLGWYIGDLAKTNVFDYASKTDARFTQLIAKVLSDRRRVM